MIGRIILTLLAVAVYGVAGFLHDAAAPLVSGRLAGLQLDNSDAAYVAASGGWHLWGGLGALLTILLLLALLGIWIGPVKRLLVGAAGAALLLTLSGSPAGAYYDKQDWAEPYFVLPNESAFFIPDVGANKDSQAKFGSEQYLSENKIPAKRFLIPHTKLDNSGGWSNYYVPSGRLIVVDRTPYAREWTGTSGRGTSKNDDAFECQSDDGLNIKVGVSIAASVTEEQSPRFLYNFGVKPPEGDRSKPEVVFTSVYYGRSLTEVMDTVVHARVQALVCDEVSTHSLDANNKQAAATMADIEHKVRGYLDSVGITLGYVGWASTFEFDPAVQESINRRFVADKEQQIAALLAPYAGTIQQLATADAIRSWGQKADGRLPQTIVGLPPGLAGLLGTLVGGGQTAAQGARP